MTLAGVDQEHLAGADCALMRSVIEMKAAHGDDQRDRDRVAVLRHSLARLQAARASAFLLARLTKRGASPNEQPARSSAPKRMRFPFLASRSATRRRRSQP